MASSTLLDPSRVHETRVNVSHSQFGELDEEAKRHLEPGHEEMHSAMAFILLVALMGSQIGLLYWKRHHSKSFELVGTLGLWSIPPIFGFTNSSWRFITIWALFALLNVFVVWKSTERPLRSLTPRLVYKFYSTVYQVCYVIGVTGYIIMFVTLMAVLPQQAFEVGVLFFFYGVYFGVLGRDTVDRISDWMAAAVGYYNKTGLTTKQLRDGVCAICGAPSGDFPDDKIETLTCEHSFHEKCIRGWVIVGKKTTCPYCKEKVDTSRFTRGPWETQQALYLSMLDFVRYLLVWQPIIFGTVNAAFYILGLD
ncbi:hypothetical protein M427DRAFT_127059 [Gonapodya prolifera JEL478]|uniref:RING-type domain-containing protein n=1 Tax=Gonapodya prolifera (strain JEL478) TaxID=1344416 RepID=A0A139A2S2_GONPJ|nr:hypothetical protein M427DRAFT_127059 [Gonapodya prolifera JEL478]|eukprot:KXS11044.1 hypothetical protein M427DRAFT_127059 [Gonapodya prolifera JEL478]